MQWFKAVERGDSGAVRTLLDDEDGKLLNTVAPTTKGGKTALMCAASGARLEMVHVLLERGALIDMVDHGGRTALYIALMAGHPAVAQLLVEKGATPNLRPIGGRYPIELAVELGVISLVQAMLRTKRKEGRYGGVTSLLQLAAKSGHLEVAELLMHEGGDILAPAFLRSSALAMAVGNGHKEVGMMMLGNVSSLETDGHRYRPVLMAGARQGDEELVQLLLERYGAQVICADSKGDTPLIEASRKGHLTVVNQLLEAARRCGPVEFADLLLHDQGPYFDWRFRSYTALKHAVENDHVEVARVLMAAQEEVLRGNGPTVRRHRIQALEAAIRTNGNKKELLCLIRDGIDDWREVILEGLAVQSAKFGCTFMLDWLLEGESINANYCIPPTAFTDVGRSLLMYASEGGHAGAVMCLLLKGARCTTGEAVHGRTALMYAAANGHVEVVSILARWSPSVDLQDSDGDTALHLACGVEDLAIALELVRCGASTLITNKSTRFALDVSDKAFKFLNGHLEVMRTLVKAHALSDSQLPTSPGQKQQRPTVLQDIVRLREGSGEGVPQTEIRVPRKREASRQHEQKKAVMIELVGMNDDLFGELMAVVAPLWNVTKYEEEEQAQSERVSKARTPTLRA